MGRVMYTCIKLIPIAMTIKCLQLYDQIMVHCMCAGVSMLWFSVCRHINVPVPWQNKYFMVFLFSLTCDGRYICSLFYCWYWWNSWPSLFKLSFNKNVFFPQYLTTIHLEYKHRIKSQIDFGDSNLNHKYKQEVPVCQYGRLAVVVSNCNKIVFLQDKTHIPVDAKFKVALTWPMMLNGTINMVISFLPKMQLLKGYFWSKYFVLL